MSFLGAAVALALSLGACSTTPAAHLSSARTTMPGFSAQDATASTDATTVPGQVPTEMLNPAVSQATIYTTICISGWTATVRPPASYTSPLKRRQIASYGYADTRPASFEMDHVVALSVGGATRAPANFYPEPIVQSHTDDVVEVATQHAVCSGRMTLAEGRAKILALKVEHGYDRTKSVV